MTPTQSQDLLRMLKDKSFGLEDLHERVRASGSAWTIEQLHLFLLCAPGVHHDQTTGVFSIDRGGDDDALRNAVVESVRSFAGKPVPAAQVRARLPNHFVTTDEQIRAIAKTTPGIQIIGPGFITIRKGD